MSGKHEPKAGRRANAEEEAKNSAGERGFFARYKWYLVAYTVAAISLAYPTLYNNYYLKKTYFDCSDYFRYGHRQDGIYEINPTDDPDRKFDVYCNMTAGGWTMLVRRSAVSTHRIDFQVPLESYKHGFGDLNGDHFIGLDNIHSLTRLKDRQLMTVVNSTQYKYNKFRIADEFGHYKIVISEEIDRFADACSMLRLNNTFFSAIDVDYDLAPNSNCSSGWDGGWWFTNCFDHSVCVTCLASHGNHGLKRLSYAALLIK